MAGGGLASATSYKHPSAAMANQVTEEMIWRRHGLRREGRRWIAQHTLLGRVLVDRATLVSRAERLALSRDLAGTVAYAGVDPTLEGRALQDALRAAIATRRGYCWWTVDHAGWVVTLDAQEKPEFYGRTLEEALAWCLVWLMAPELGIGPFRVQ